jgi:UDP-glucuronate decarboxylase
MVAMCGTRRHRARALGVLCVLAIGFLVSGTNAVRTGPENGVGVGAFERAGRQMMEEEREAAARAATTASASASTSASKTSVAEIGMFDADAAHAKDASDAAKEMDMENGAAVADTRPVKDAWATSAKEGAAASLTTTTTTRRGEDGEKSNTKEFADGEPLGRGSVVKNVPVPIPKATRLRVLVTGGAGFVGSHLVDRLMERGNIVIVADNFFTGRKENIMHHLQNPFFELIRHDVVEPMLVEVDQIYHLACPASPVHYKHNPVKTIKTSVMGTLNMLGLAKRVGARMLLTSTSEVYGDPLQHPQKEEYWGNVNPIGVRSCYDEGKRVAETLCFDYHRQEGVDIRIARIFNTYGPRMALEDGRVVSNFVSQALRGEPMTIYGDGKQTRSFQYVDDLVAGLMALMDNEKEIGPVNIGNPGEFTMLELAEVVKEVVNPNAKIVYKENTMDDPGRRRPDITKAKTTLGWEPKVELRDGLPKMVADFRERLNLPKTEL